MGVRNLCIFGQKIKPTLEELERKGETLREKESELSRLHESIEENEAETEALVEDVEKNESEKLQLTQDKEVCKQKLERGKRLLEELRQENASWTKGDRK